MNKRLGIVLSGGLATIGVAGLLATAPRSNERQTDQAATTTTDTQTISKIQGTQNSAPVPAEQAPATQPTPAPTSAAPPAPIQTPPPAPKPQPGAYVDYSSTIIGQTPGSKLLFFHASWCSQCRKIEADISNNGIPEGVTVIKVDYDNQTDLRRRHGVTQQTSFVLIDDQGNSQKKYVAYSDPTISAVIKNLL